MRFARVLSRLFHPLPAAVAAILLSLLLFDAFPADSVNYHLPFSIRFLGIPGFPDLTSILEARYQGFPVLWRLLLGPGLIWNHPRLLILPNVFALGLLAFAARRLMRLSPPILICCCLAFPVSLYLFRSSLQDFFVNVVVMTASICLFAPTQRCDQHEMTTSWITRWDLLGLFCLSLAANIKYQGLLMAMLILALSAGFRSYDHANRLISEPWHIPKANLVLAVLLSLSIFVQPVVNLVRFSNPFYPIQSSLWDGPEARIESPIQYVPKVPLLSPSLSYLASVTEIDPIIRSQPGFSFKRSWHNHNQPKRSFLPAPQDYPWVVTGGSNGLFFLIVLSYACMSVFSRRGEKLAQNRSLSLLRKRLLIVSFLYMFLPQSMELRYYMVALYAPAIVSVAGDKTTARSMIRGLVVLCLWIALIPSFLKPLYFRIRSGEWSVSDGLLTSDVYARLPSAKFCRSKYQINGSSKANNLASHNQYTPEFLQCMFRMSEMRH